MIQARLYRRGLWQYLFAVLAVAAGVALRLAFLSGVSNLISPFITFYPAVILAALFGGLVPGLLSTVLSGVLASYLLMPPTTA